jgi:hypothetical protein
VRTIGAKYRLELSDTFSIDARYQHNDARPRIPALQSAPSAAPTIATRKSQAWVSTGRPRPMVEVLVKGYWHDWNTRYTDILNSVLPPYTQTVSSDKTLLGV